LGNEETEVLKENKQVNKSRPGAAAFTNFTPAF
jgi:hypothetical protein